MPCLPPGDLGAIAKEYDIAVSTSCPALDYIVVETTSAAQRCVELLRQRQLGVATFLILEKQQHLGAAAKEKKQPPEGGWDGAVMRSRSWGRQPKQQVMLMARHRVWVEAELRLVRQGKPTAAWLTK